MRQAAPNLALQCGGHGRFTGWAWPPGTVCPLAGDRLPVKVDGEPVLGKMVALRALSPIAGEQVSEQALSGLDVPDRRVLNHTAAHLWDQSRIRAIAKIAAEVDTGSWTLHACVRAYIVQVCVRFCSYRRRESDLVALVIATRDSQFFHALLVRGRAHPRWGV